MKTLRELLKERGIKNVTVAKALGVRPDNLSRFDILSERSLREIKIIADAIGVSWLFLSELALEDVYKNSTKVEEPTSVYGVKKADDADSIARLIANNEQLANSIEKLITTNDRLTEQLLKRTK